jgi:chromosome segregation ATPase
MAEKVSPTLSVLREIRDEIKGTNHRLDRLEEQVGGLERRQSESEVRLATELVTVARAVTEVRDLLRERLDVSDRMENHERRINALERRVGP